MKYYILFFLFACSIRSNAQTEIGNSDDIVEICKLIFSNDFFWEKNQTDEEKPIFVVICKGFTKSESFFVNIDTKIHIGWSSYGHLFPYDDIFSVKIHRKRNVFTINFSTLYSKTKKNKSGRCLVTKKNGYKMKRIKFN